MEIRQLEYFIAVASEMNFSRAADRVHVVQSALSTSVGKLEKELGVELLDRSRRQIRLTPAGEIFLENARRVVLTARSAKESISDYRGQLSGTVEFGSLVSFGPLEVPRILGDFHRTHPLVRINLRQSQSGSMSYLVAIADGSMDLALVSEPERFPANVNMRLLSEEPMIYVCRPDHSLASREYVDIRELAEEYILGFSAGFGLQRVVAKAFAEAGMTPRTPNELTIDFSAAADLVRHGLGSIFMPLSEAGRFPDLVSLPIVPEIHCRIFLAWAKGEPVRRASATLAELLLESAGRASRPPKP